MSKLKHCPFCGSNAEVITGANWVQIGCPKCDITTRTVSIDDDTSTVIETWNARYDRTCYPVTEEVERGYGDDLDIYLEEVCSECGCSWASVINFCPNCGAKAVAEPPVDQHE